MKNILISPQQIVEKLRFVFGDKRIVNLLHYGSSATGRNFTEKSDLDLYLILDSPQSDDIKHLKSIILENPKLDFSLQYESILERKGVNNFQHGNHGIFFLFYLATADSLIGENYFAKRLAQVDLTKEKLSLLYQIEEYFWRLSKWYLYEIDSVWILYYQKYILRVCIDMLLFEDLMPYREVSALSHLEIIDRYIRNAKMFSMDTKNLITKQYSEPKTELWTELRDALYQDYLSIFSAFYSTQDSNHGTS